MSVADSIGKGVGLVGFLGGSSDKLIEKATEQKEIEKQTISDKIEVKDTIGSEVAELQNVLVQVKKKAESLILAGDINAWKKHVSVRTDDTAGVADYIKNVVADSQNCHNGEEKISVVQIATKSELVISGVLQTAFSSVDPINLNGTISLKFNGGSDIDIPVSGAETINDVLANINNKLANSKDAGGGNLEAYLSPAGNGNSYIKIRAKETGGNSDISFNWTPGSNPMDHMEVLNDSNISGQDAQIKLYNSVDPISQPSNKFINVVPGLSFELAGKVNAVNEYNYIDVCDDHNSFKSMIAEFGDSITELSYLIAKNSQESRSYLGDKNSDPNKELESYNAKNAPLRGSLIIEEAKMICEKFMTTQSVKASGGIVSVSDLGISVKQSTKNGVTYDDLFFEDEDKMTKAFMDDFEAVRCMFVSSAKVDSVGGVVGKLSYIPSVTSKPIPVSVESGIISVKINYVDGTLEADNFKATIPSGQEVSPTSIKYYDHGVNSYYSVSFDGTDLEGMSFAVYPGSAGTNEDNFVVDCRVGLANSIRYDANNMLGDDMTGTTVEYGNANQENVERLKVDLQKINDEIDKIRKKSEADFQTIGMMDTMAAIQMASIEAALGINDSK